VLLALGPLLLDTTDRTVVVGMLDGIAPGAMAKAAAGADVVWLRSPSPEHVGTAGRETGLPVGVTDDVGALGDLVAAGAVAVECDAADAVDHALRNGVTLWCGPVQAGQALAAGVARDRIISEPGDGGRAVIGATVVGAGPGTWGHVVRMLGAGAGVVRTTDVRAVRRVVTVADRLRAARPSVDRTVIA
jgi:hypothetical protein